MHSNDVRRKFIEFFQGKGHSFVPSSSVVPLDDPTLLFANAGMNQFKPIFLGQKTADVARAVNSQKCIRAGGKHNDLEEVGKDGYHHTFFEMLGNWSFGDYYKKEAITWAWELLTKVYGLDKKLLHASVYQTDQDAYNLWSSETDIDPEHISFHGDKDNFWEMGDSGPCGPCSEIHYDRGAELCDKKDHPDHICAVNGDCSRYIELWNLVFIQYNRDNEGALRPLSQSFVDTGAGLERLCQVLQGVSSNYDTDLFQVIINKISSLCGIEYKEETGISHRVIADHIRSLCFALADGGFPSNEGRGYVLRRILRRAARHGRLLGFKEPFLWLLVDTLVDQMGNHFNELMGKASFIKMVIKAEEERFNKTLDTGLQKFSELTLNTTSVKGEDAFMLYDTYGFPLDLTQILAEEKGLSVDIAAFEREMEKQRERARSASKFTQSSSDQEWITLKEYSGTEFLGYTQTEVACYICKYRLSEDSSVQLILDKSPFYAESGGQVADQGSIQSEDFDIQIVDVRKIPEGTIHIGKIVSGLISGTEANARIDQSLRKDTARNHTATHILHKALRDILGDSVQQKGSLVSPDHLRFDFAFLNALSVEQIRAVEEKVNWIIRENLPVQTDLLALEEAKAKGATALFGEKYSDIVRVVSIAGYSKELCGGTHVQFTGELGSFKILSESSSAAGIRRIEALTGRAAYARQLENEDLLLYLTSLFSTNVSQLKSKSELLIQQHHMLNTEIRALKEKLIRSELQTILDSAQTLQNMKLIIKLLDPDADLRTYGDLLLSRLNNTIAVLFTDNGESISVQCLVSKDLIPHYHAGTLVKEISAHLSGKGGGRADSAMGGGKDRSKLSDLLNKLPELISKYQ